MNSVLLEFQMCVCPCVPGRLLDKLVGYVIMAGETIPFRLRMKNNPLPRLDEATELRERLLAYCRLAPGQVWEDPQGQHRVGCLDAADPAHIAQLMGGYRATLAIHDPPYNLVAFPRRSINEFITWCRSWVSLAAGYLKEDASFYIWLGADQNDGFQPLPDFMIMMRGFHEFQPR